MGGCEDAAGAVAGSAGGRDAGGLSMHEAGGRDAGGLGSAAPLPSTASEAHKARIDVELPIAVMQRVAADMTMRHVPYRDLVARCGLPADHLFLVKSGNIKVW